MFRVGLKQIRVGRPTGTTHTFYLSLRTKYRFSNRTIESDVAHCVSESSHDSVSDTNRSSKQSMEYNCQTNNSDQTRPSHSNERASFNSISDLSYEIEHNLNPGPPVGSFC